MTKATLQRRRTIPSDLPAWFSAPAHGEYVMVEAASTGFSFLTWAGAVAAYARIGMRGHEWVRATSQTGYRWCQILGDPIEGVIVEVGQGAGDARAVSLTDATGAPTDVAERYREWRSAAPAGNLHTVREAIEIARAWVLDAELPEGVTLRPVIA